MPSFSSQLYIFPPNKAQHPNPEHLEQLKQPPRTKLIVIEGPLTTFQGMEEATAFGRNAYGRNSTTATEDDTEGETVSLCTLNDKLTPRFSTR